MLPIPHIDFIPKFFKRDAKLTAYADMIDSILQDLSDDTIGLNDLIDPIKCPATLLNDLGYLVNAGIIASNTETEKRIKIITAVQGHKRRGSFNLDAKPKIDNIAGGDSQIFRSFDLDDFILVGDGLTPLSHYWSVLGCDGIDLDQGISLIGSGFEVEVAGNIYIDVDNNALTAEELEKIVLELKDIRPAYMFVHLGYIDGTGAFIEYIVLGV